MRIFLWICLIFTAQRQNSVQTCRNRSALQNVDVSAHQIRYNQRENYVDVDFHSLDTYEIIDVTRANVTELCEGMIRQFPKLEHLSMINVNLEHLAVGVFQDVPRLVQVSFSVNNLSELVKGSLRNLDQLRVLYLSGNRIEDIQNGVFDDTPELRKIYLDRNRLKEIDGGWFASNRHLTVIELSHNGISKVQRAAFTLQAENLLDVEIFLRSNLVEVVEVGAVTANGVSPLLRRFDENEKNASFKPELHLHLESNTLEELPPAELVPNLLQETGRALKLYFNSNQINCISNDWANVLHMERFTLHLEENPFNCDCLIKLDEIQRHYPRAALYFNSSQIERANAECRFREFLKTPPTPQPWP